MTTESPLLKTQLAARSGANQYETGEYFGVVLPAQFTSPAEEHRIARASAALLDTNFRAVLELTGTDRARYLNAITTGNIRDLAAGQGSIGLLLNSQGHILAELETFALPDRLIILGHELVREATAAVLDKFIIMDDAVLTDVTAAAGFFAIEGPRAPEIVRALTGMDIEQLPLRGHAEGGIAAPGTNLSETIPCRVIRHSLFGFPGAEILVARKSLAAAWIVAESAVREHGGAPAGYRALNMLRLEAGVAWFGADFGERQIPHEAALESTHISFTKGCYTGQEIVERVRSRGHVNRRLTGLAFNAAAAPPAGTTLTAGGVSDAACAAGSLSTSSAPNPGSAVNPASAPGAVGSVGGARAEAGYVTSAAWSPSLGKPIGLGYVRREYGTPGTSLRYEHGVAEVITLPLPAA